MTETKWTLNLGTEIKKDEIIPELTIKDKCDENSELSLTISKDKIYANYEVKF